jgi:hypothetical protein
MTIKNKFVVRLETDGWIEQLVYADQVVALENEPWVFLDEDKTIAAFFAFDMVESWREQEKV